MTMKCRVKTRDTRVRSSDHQNWIEFWRKYIFLPHWRENLQPNFEMQVQDGGSSAFSRCPRCSKSITSSQSALRVEGYCISAWCQARLVTVTGWEWSSLASRDPLEACMRTKQRPLCSVSEPLLW